MNIIINTFGVGYGGMEVLFAGLAKYAISNKHTVFILTLDKPNNIYYKLLGIETDNLHYIFSSDKDILYMTKKDKQKQKKSVLNQLSKYNIDYSQTLVFAGYYKDLLMVNDIFSQINQIRVLFIWPHPMDWIHYLFPEKSRTYHWKKLIGNEHYNYQKELLQELEVGNAHYFTSYAISDYNKWYYEVPFTKRKIEGLPVQKSSGLSFEYNYDVNLKKIRFIWVGRFDYFKNDAIKHIIKTLEKLKIKYSEYEFVFNIYGRGSEQYTTDIENNAKSDLIEINLFGTIPPDKLNEVFAQNDIGIGMGVTVKQMGYSGLPAILIDSLNDSYKTDKYCNWVFDIATGDDGDGFYYYIADNQLPYRKSLYNLVEEIIQEPSKLNDYSKKCKEYTETNYSCDRQYTCIIDRAAKSEYHGTKLPTYQYSRKDVVKYNTYYFVRKIVKTIIGKK